MILIQHLDQQMEQLNYQIQILVKYAFILIFIQNTKKPINQLIVLNKDKGIRLASINDENFAIIWTLGKNYIQQCLLFIVIFYPERKLFGFKQKKIYHIMDLAYSNHLICQSDTHLQIINYHNNRIFHNFDFNSQLIEFIYLSKYEKFTTISQGNILLIYSLRLNGNTSQIYCELESILLVIAIYNISSCIGVEFEDEIIICYGCVIVRQNYIIFYKNILLGELQIFNNKIKEMIVQKQEYQFVLVVIVENEKQIKWALLQKDRVAQLDKYGELIDCPSKNGKYIMQLAVQQNKHGIYLLSETQKDIGLYELC